MKIYNKLKILIFIISITVYSQFLFAQNIHIDYKEEFYSNSKLKLTMNIKRPIIQIRKDEYLSKKINDSITSKLNLWKNEIIRDLEFLISNGGSILNSRPFFSANFEVDTVSFYDNSLHFLFNYKTENMSANIYSYGYKLLSYSLNDGKYITSKLKKYFLINGKNISLHQLIIDGLKDSSCKPRFLFYIDDIVPLTNDKFYIPYSIDYANELTDCKENNNSLLKIYVSRAQIEELLKECNTKLVKVIVPQAKIYKESKKVRKNCILYKGEYVSLIEIAGEWCKVEFFYNNSILTIGYIKKTDIQLSPR